MIEVGNHTEREAGHRDAEGPAVVEPPEADRDLGTGQGRQQGANHAGYAGRRRNTARGPEREVEAIRGWVWVMSRWTALCASKGGEGQV